MTATARKAYKGIGMEGSMARWYARNTRKDYAEFLRLAERLRDCLPQGGDVLEVAPGPGFLAIEMARSSAYRVTGLDISKTCVELARENAQAEGVRVDFRRGNASEMPFEDNSFDLLVCRAAFKNFSEPEGALQEMRRVLRPGGTGVVIDLRRDAPMAEIRRYAEGLNLSVWNRWFMLLTFRFLLLKRAFTTEQMEKLVGRIGFKKAELRTTDISMEAWFEK